MGPTIVFVAFSVVFLREPLGWPHLVGLTLIATGAAIIFLPRSVA